MLRIYRPFLKPGLVILVVLFGALLGIFPAIRTSFHLWGEYRMLTKDARELSRTRSILESLDAETLKTNAVDMGGVLPTEKSLPSILATLDAMSSRTEVGILDVSFSGTDTLTATASAKQEATHPSGARLVQLTTSIDGTVSQVGEFLKLFGSVRRFLGVRSFQITVTPTDRMQVKLELDGYYLPLAKTGGKPAVISPLSQEEETVLANISAFPLIAQTPPLLPLPASAANPDPFTP